MRLCAALRGMAGSVSWRVLAKRVASCVLASLGHGPPRCAVSWHVLAGWLVSCVLTQGGALRAAQGAGGTQSLQDFCEANFGAAVCARFAAGGLWDSFHYGEMYADERFEFRNVRVPRHWAQRFNHSRLLEQHEWRASGIRLGEGWEHHAWFGPEPSMLLLRRPRRARAESATQTDNIEFDEGAHRTDGVPADSQGAQRGVASSPASSQNAAGVALCVSDAPADSQVAVAGEPDMCECSGNCGVFTCRKRAMQRCRYAATTRVCSQAVVKGRFCAICACEFHECTSPRNSSRWCIRHKGILGGSELPKYVTCWGIFAFAPAWPLILRVLARIGFSLALAPPLDFSEWQKLCCLVCPPQVGVEIDAVALVWLFVAQAAKWPPVLRLFQRAWEAGRMHPEEPPEKTLCRTIVHALRWAHDKRLPQMHAGMSGGRSHAATGLVRLASGLGLVSRRRGTAASHAAGNRSADSQGCVLRLGVRGVEYELADTSVAERWLQQVFAVAQEANLHWPSDELDASAFADAVLAFACRARRLKEGEVGMVTRAGLSGGRSPDYQYLAQYFTRHVLLAWATCGWQPDAFLGCPMERILDWTPDVGGHCLPIRRCTGREVQERFGLHPLWVSYHTCRLGALTATELNRLLAASDWQLLAPMHAWLQQHLTAADEADAAAPHGKAILESMGTMGRRPSAAAASAGSQETPSRRRRPAAAAAPSGSQEVPSCRRRPAMATAPPGKRGRTAA